MLTEAAHLHLGDGTHSPDRDEPAGSAPTPAAGAGAVDVRPGVVVDRASLPDGPPSVKAGQRDPNPSAEPGGRVLPLEAVSRLLGGGL